MKNKKKAMLLGLMLTASNLAGCASQAKSMPEENVVVSERPAIETPYVEETPVVTPVVDNISVQNGKQLFEDVKNSGLNINLTEEQAQIIVEWLNDNHTNKLTEETLDAVENIIKFNLRPETEKTIDLGKYVEYQEDKELIWETTKVSRRTVREIESIDGIVRWEDINNVDSASVSFINYNYEVTSKYNFLVMPALVRFVVQTTLNETNNYLPKEAFVVRRSSEDTTREFELYNKYFTNDLEKKVYLPRRTANDEIEYVYTYSDCSEEKYTEEEMLALDAEKLEIWQRGPQIENENRIAEAINEIKELNQQKTYVK